MNTSKEQIASVVTAQRQFFLTGLTLPIAYRCHQLRRLEQALSNYESALAEALWIDLHKSYEEAYLTEFGIIYSEIKNHIRHLRRWARPERKCSPLSVFPGRTQVLHEPLGTALIIAPWNYPVQLLLNPLIGAISAGCTAVLKPSPYVPHVSSVLVEMIQEAFDERYIAIMEGHREINTMLLEQRWDMIFFTGSPVLGRVVMAAAAKNLTPLVLELGGKSPCIVDQTADLALSAKRIAWGKALNAGQTCIAPDYLMVHKDVVEPFLSELKQAFEVLLGKDAKECKHFVRIVSDKAMDRLSGYLQDGELYYGGKTDPKERYFSPTILTKVSPDAKVMQEEIFGPIFPVMEFEQIDEVIDFVNQREKPLALYYFGQEGERILAQTSAGGSCINDCIVHIINPDVPFGGVGNSGMHSYHGKESYMAFTHRRSVVCTPTWIDVPFRYMPYKLFKYIKHLC